MGPNLFTRRIFVRSFVFSALLLALLGTPALAQQTSVSIYRGTSEYDLSGVDQATSTAVRLSRDLNSWIVVEGGLSFVELQQQFGHSKLYMPEMLIQLQLPIGRFAPYVGAGAGLGIDVPENNQFSTDTDPTFLAGAGLRVDLPFNLLLGVDGRIRGFTTRFTGSGAEASVGVGFRF
jgi:hypothetical protein